uniref:ATP synthase subunit a n=1 Tax=Gyge ovalis TaxID=2008693 RepID=A0A343DSD0_9CRUS|nr:ATP synthase subunit 6 [Gyge ovalis]ASC43037.1 ATP synthase subunit 6 [Gyge ovalis]
MMTNLFSIFEPSVSFTGYPMGWLSVLLGPIFLARYYWASTGRYLSMSTSLLGSLMGEMKVLFKTNLSSLVLLPLSLWVLVSVSNMAGLMPHVFTCTSHLSFTLSLALPVWGGLMMYAIFYHLYNVLAHLVPQGTPPALMMFMVVIETISSVIRPITLAVRLSANMIAGHLLLALLGGVVDSASVTSLSGAVPALLLLLILESAVALIQAYVFATLISLNLSEV